MKVQVKKQSVMEGTKLIKELYFLTIEEHTINIGKKTYETVEQLIKIGKTPETNEQMNKTLIKELSKKAS